MLGTRDREPSAILDKATIGQTIFLEEDMVIGAFKNDPETFYDGPHIFTIIDKCEKYYHIRDKDGHVFMLKLNHSDTTYLYDANEWAMWLHKKEDNQHKLIIRNIKKYAKQNALLKSILKQGDFRILSKKQAEFLGIKE